MSLNPSRTITELKELRAFTGDEHGAQRVAFTPVWLKARAWFREKLATLPVEVHQDAAGNLWATLRGASERELLIGGHLDSVPNGGWLDGALDVLAGLEVLRRICRQYHNKPPLTVRLVDWADEEGARFGKSLFGSSACSGSLELEAVRGLKDKDGISLPEALRTVGVDFERVMECGVELQHAAAYIELHIEQGPVLLDLDLPLGAVTGTFGVERHAITFRGQAAHSGSTPMNRRRDAFLAAGKLSQEIYRIAERSGGGVCTIGSCTTKPGIVTSVVEECRVTLDQRHLDSAALAEMWREAQEACERFAAEGGLTVAWETLQQIAPQPFHPELIALGEEAITETSGHSHRLPSGPLHDASEMARAGIPTAMLFVQSLHARPAFYFSPNRSTLARSSGPRMIPFPEIEKIAEPARPAMDAGGAWWWWVAAVLLGLIVLGIAAGLIAALARRASLPGVPVRPEKLALREIKALRRRAGELDGPAFGAALTEIVRAFLHRRTGMPARFATTEQILGRSRRADDPPPPPLVVNFAPVLEGCDTLKFGGGTPAARESLLDAAEAAVKTLSFAPPPRVLTILPPITDAPPA
jgi:hydantoinase/carbamoylase family amidase